VVTIEIKCSLVAPQYVHVLPWVRYGPGLV